MVKKGLFQKLPFRKRKHINKPKSRLSNQKAMPFLTHYPATCITSACNLHQITMSSASRQHAK
ncbi:hypothetical protein HMPREF0971_01935 [Segatella oris F0302]|uniref:Uncharacterized protein n=1 Tax=Segatella oris F0302 TaxID=649760 RepID=D1QSH5_9BACT|nr:hypothetical protein HMPREF0971_01935 [Segatella oris F0302]